jgi:hypothetical protein
MLIFETQGHGSLRSRPCRSFETIFRKQLLSWTKSEGYRFLDEIDLDALMSFS